MDPWQNSLSRAVVVGRASVLGNRNAMQAAYLLSSVAREAAVAALFSSRAKFAARLLPPV